MREIFVFGSNLAGVHGAGAARFAKLQHGAVWGQGEGLQGDSYGIPTKDESIRTRGLTEIEQSVVRFLAFAGRHPEMAFRLTPIGCGLAGYKPEQIAPMFRDAPSNVNLPDEFRAALKEASSHAD